jgi:tetratricopeptide (TPR) repeat protein
MFVTSRATQRHFERDFGTEAYRASAVWSFWRRKQSAPTAISRHGRIETREMHKRVDLCRPRCLQRGTQIPQESLMRFISCAKLVASVAIAATSFSFGSRASGHILGECSEPLDPADAIAACTAIISSSWATDHHIVGALNNRANAYDYLGNRQAAIEDYSRALALDPHYANAYFNRGTIHLALKDFTNAIADLTSALRFAPRLVAALNNRGLALLERGDLDAAIDDFTSAIDITQRPLMPITIGA